MGKKGKKGKGAIGPVGDASSSQAGPPAQQPQQQPQQQQQQQQQQQPQQQRQQPAAPVDATAAGVAQISMGSGRGLPAGGDMEQQQRGFGRGRGRRQHTRQDPIPGMQQQGPPVGAVQGPRPGQAPPAQAQAPVPGVQRQGPPVGAVQGPRPGQAPPAQAQAPIPGVQRQGPPVGAAQGPRPGQAPPAQAQAPIPGVQQGRPGQEQQKPRKSAPSPARSTASSDAGEKASLGSGKSGGGKKPSSQQTGASPVKVSLTPAQQAAYRDKIPRRKNPHKGGTAGRPITVETNMTPITFTKNFPASITHYDVKLDPDRPKFMYRRVMEKVRQQHYPQNFPAFDGRCNLFAAGNLPFGHSLHTEVEVMNDQRQSTMTFKVAIVKTQDVNMSWLKNVKPGLVENDRELISIQALDVVLRSAPFRQNAITVGRSFFTQPAPGRVVDLGNGLDLWVGTFQAAVLGWKPYFNVDVAHKGFPSPQPVIKLMEQLVYNPRGDIQQALQDDRERRKVHDYLKGLKVTYEIPGKPSSRRTMGINDLAKSSKEATFELQDGSVTTVQNYFAREKQYKIRYPDLPTLWVGSKNKLVLIPAELCTIEAGQVTNKKMDEKQTATMIKYAATNAETRKQKILEGFSKMRFNEDPAMREFGISVSGEFEKVKARVLNPPSLFDKREIAVRKGVWRANSFHTAMELPPKSWTILNLNDRTQETPIRNMVGTLQRAATSVGMKIGDPLTPFKNMRAPLRDLREIIAFFNEKKREGLKLIIVIVPDRFTAVYGKVKQVAELNVGVLTQCIKAFTVERKMNDATAGNILLKINSKLNGTNQIFTVGKNPPCLNRPCMIVGADVTHPSPDAVGIPSIAAVAASHGPRAFKYNVKIRLQPPKTEIILHLEEIMREQLLFFYKSTKYKPERIIFYRDGVSEGQFPQVMHHELQAIRNACSKMSTDNTFQPKITFLVVQKRHHIRLFPTDSRNSDDRNGNVQAGTVVDTDITHPSHIDFYLVSHASIQGTARPTKYRCLWDDSDMSEDEIEQLTYYLCHMFSRCTRSVSYPAPTYYAHLAAFRARALTNEVDIRLNNLEEEQRTKMTIKPEIQMGNPMFFV